MFANTQRPRECGRENEVIQERSRDALDVVQKRNCFLFCFVKRYCYLFCITSDITPITNDRGNILQTSCKASLKKNNNWILLCSAYAWIGTHAMFPVMSFFSCSKFSVRDYNTSNVIQGKHSRSADRKYNYRECWCYIIRIKRCFPHTTQWLLFHVLAICLYQSDENHSVHGCPFWAIIFRRFFSGCDNCILKSTTAWLLKLSVLNIHSSMRVHNRTFQTKTVFNNVTEVHNSL